MRMLFFFAFLCSCVAGNEIDPQTHPSILYDDKYDGPDRSQAYPKIRPGIIKCWEPIFVKLEQGWNELTLNTAASLELWAYYPGFPANLFTNTYANLNFTGWDHKLRERGWNLIQTDEKVEHQFKVWSPRSFRKEITIYQMFHFGQETRPRVTGQTKDEDGNLVIPTFLGKVKVIEPIYFYAEEPDTPMMFMFDCKGYF